MPRVKNVKFLLDPSVSFVASRSSISEAKSIGISVDE